MQDPHETSSLIGANKVEGTKVFNETGEELGKIHEIMIDKASGQRRLRRSWRSVAFSGWARSTAHYLGPR